MENDECDLDTLTALLDEDGDSSNEKKDRQPDEVNQNAADNFCFSDSDEEETLQALEMLNENDTSSKTEGENSCHVKGESSTVQNSTPQLSAPAQPVQVNETKPQDAVDLQDELRKMQEKMMELQKQLASQQQSSQTQQPKSEKKVPVEKSTTRPPQSSVLKTKSHTNPSDVEKEENPFFAMENDKSLKSTKKKKLSKDEKSPSENESKFFPDSDSDWEDMDGEKEAGLSKEGKSLKKLLTSGPRKRDAHSADYSPSVFKKQIPEARWKEKPQGEESKKKSSATNLSGKCTEKEDVMTFYGIRIINPKVSSEMLKIKMDGRKLLKMNRLCHKLNPADLEGNWVTFGVLVHKSEPRKSANGNTYCIWKLSDLDDEDKTMTFFLFREVYKQHWKAQTGTVFGLLNPNLMQKAEKFQSENSFTVDHPGQLLVVGQSKDLGTCKGTTKSGKVCTNFINKRQGEYCKYHVQSVYKKVSAKRGDLQSGFSGISPKTYDKKIIPSGSHVFYGGQTFSTLPSCGKGVNKNNVSLKQLQSHNSVVKGKVTTLSLHELEEMGDTNDKKNTGPIQEKPFLDFLTTPTVGSLNLVKHLIKKESSCEEKQNKVLIESVSPAQLLKQHKAQMNELRQRKSGKLASPKLTPQLGRGFQPGQDIFLGKSSSLSSTPSPRSRKPQSSDIAKKVAIAKVLSKGGIAKDDPNAVRKSKSSPENEKRIRKRVADNLHGELEEEISPPPAKRSRYLGNVDLNSEKVQKLLKSKSSHSGALAELEADRKEKYFGELEKKEQYEEKMLSLTEIKCKAYTCFKCKYTALSTSDLCKSEGHKVNQIKAVKRFYKCNSCGTRTLTLHRYPTIPCRSCHGKSFEKTSMWKEKDGPKLESEVLLVTGDAVKYLDSQIR